MTEFDALKDAGGCCVHPAETCYGDSWKLSNTNFCFNPKYVLTADDSASSAPLPVISVTNGQSWGSWSNFAQCPPNSWASGFNARVQSRQGIWRDDTALNAISIRCTNSSGAQTATDVRPHNGWVGDWWGYYNCPVGQHIVGFQMQVEGSQGPADDTAANTVKVRCSGGGELVHTTTNWGTWGSWAQCPSGTAVCAVKVKIEQNGVADPTALTDAQ
eukprot:gene12756-12885_t